MKVGVPCMTNPFGGLEPAQKGGKVGVRMPPNLFSCAHAS